MCKGIFKPTWTCVNGLAMNEVLILSNCKELKVPSKHTCCHD